MEALKPYESNWVRARKQPSVLYPPPFAYPLPPPPGVNNVLFCILLFLHSVSINMIIDVFFLISV